MSRISKHSIGGFNIEVSDGGRTDGLLVASIHLDPTKHGGQSLHFHAKGDEEPIASKGTSGDAALPEVPEGAHAAAKEAIRLHRAG